MTIAVLFPGDQPGLLSYLKTCNMDMRQDGFMPSPRVKRIRSTVSLTLHSGAPAPTIVPWQYGGYNRPFYAVERQFIVLAAGGETSFARTNAITDLCRFEDGAGLARIVVCHGSAAVMELATNDATPAFTPATSVYLKYATLCDSDLYAVTNKGVASNWMISVCPSDADPLLTTNWSAGEPCGSPLYPINALRVCNGVTVPCKPEGIFVWSDILLRYVNKITWDFMPHSLNGVGSFQGKSSVFYPTWDGGLYRFDGSGIDDVSPRRFSQQHRDAPHLRCRITSGCDAGEWILAATAPWEVGWTRQGMTVVLRRNPFKVLSGTGTAPTLYRCAYNGIGGPSQLPVGAGAIDILCCPDVVATEDGDGTQRFNTSAGTGADKVVAASATLGSLGGNIARTLKWSLGASVKYAHAALTIRGNVITGVATGNHNNQTGTAVGSLTWSHTCVSEAKLLVVTVSHRTPSTTVSGVTYNGVALTKAGSNSPTPASTDPRVEIWYLLSATLDTSAHNVVVTFSGTVTAAVAGSSDFWNCGTTAADVFPENCDLTTYLADGSWTNDMNLAGLGQGDTDDILIGCNDPFEAVKFDVSVPNTAVEYIKSVDYYGAGGWTSIGATGYFDGTIEGGVGFAKDGYVAWRDFYKAISLMKKSDIVCLDTGTLNKYWARLRCGPTGYSVTAALREVAILYSRPPLSSDDELAYTGPDNAGRFSHILAGQPLPDGTWRWEDLFCIPTDDPIVSMAYVEADLGIAEANIGNKLIMLTQHTRFVAMMSAQPLAVGSVNENYTDRASGLNLGTPVVVFSADPLTTAGQGLDRKTVREIHVEGEYVDHSDTITILGRWDHRMWDTIGKSDSSPFRLTEWQGNAGLRLMLALAYEDPDTEIATPRILSIEAEYIRQDDKFDAEPQGDRLTPEVE